MLVLPVSLGGRGVAPLLLTEPGRSYEGPRMSGPRAGDTPGLSHGTAPRGVVALLSAARKIFQCCVWCVTSETAYLTSPSVLCHTWGGTGASPAGRGHLHWEAGEGGLADGDVTRKISEFHHGHHPSEVHQEHHHCKKIFI